MTTTLEQQLWAAADILRGKMDASEYKNYLLGLVFYKYLSDAELREVYEQENGQTKDFPTRSIQYQTLTEWFEEDAEELTEIIQLQKGYFIQPAQLFYTYRQQADRYEFNLTDLQAGFNELERQGNLFKGLFADIDLTSTKLGSNAQQRNVTITEVLRALDEIDLFEHDGDVIGDAYEYLIGQFAAGAGKKAGEFYTPQAVSRIISEITSIGQEDRTPFHIYDPTMGSGSLMLNIRRYLSNPKQIHYHGQELNTTTYNLARMNLILHGVDQERMDLNNGDTLDSDWPTEEPYQFDAVVMNPPYSAKWSAADKFLSDQRFERFGKLAPKSKADFAFLLHGFYHLKDTGTMGIVLPHGVLFRGAAEGTIRQALLEMGAIDAVIGLPANIFYGTSIPTTVIILKKNRATRDVFFIDASNDFDKQKNQNILLPAHIEKIVTAYKEREDTDKYSHVASFEEIQENDFNLNIPRYVDTFEEEEQVNLVQVSDEIAKIENDLSNNQSELLDMINTLAVTEESKEIIEATKSILAGGQHE
ncbi:type I restriction-modification system subunit M [Leuconostoc mesenteroides]|uniref:type I restriction-modification system subunit M n=1 Tax=Leuconostoc mesenteroides TaxID=1245 RepID=UPI0027304001|nr:type I restriction-modification system subunit M [Leuconostoc mesenteroides]MDP0486788.1 type I restriction-modification system subunit M [Leuconostoc mesenteroides]